MPCRQNIERLLFVQPPHTIFRDEAKGCQAPLGLGYLAAVMESRLDVPVLDAVAEGYATETAADNVGFFIATPYPSTELEAICRAQGYQPQDVSFDELRVRRGNISTPEFTAAELGQMVTRELLWQKLSLVTRPRVFFERVVVRVWRDPGWALGHGARLVRQWWDGRG